MTFFVSNTMQRLCYSDTSLGFGNPDIYLGVKLCKTKLHIGAWTWALHPMRYAHEIAWNYAVHLAANCGGRFRTLMRAKNPFKMGYEPDLDTSPELEPDAASHYLTVIGILWWMMELGRIDIEKGHLDTAVHAMAHIGQRYKSWLVSTSSYTEIDHNVFKKCNWSQFYRDTNEAIHIFAPKPWGKEVDILMFVDGDHA